MELHPDGTNTEINGGRALISAISRMSEVERAALPADVQSAYDVLWGMWLERRERQMPKITDPNRYYV